MWSLILTQCENLFITLCYAIHGNGRVNFPLQLCSMVADSMEAWVADVVEETVEILHIATVVIGDSKTVAGTARVQ